MKNRPLLKYREIQLTGLATSPGIAIGTAFIFRPFKINLNELKAQVDEIKLEWSNLEKAIEKVKTQLDLAQKTSELQYGDQFSEIFSSQKAFLEDPVLLSEIRHDMEKSGMSAALVVSKILSEKTNYFMGLDNEYFRERGYDIMDLKQKLIHALLGIDTDYDLSRPSIVVADMLSPSDTVQFNRNFILGFLTDKGGQTSHAAIMARGLRIPAVVNGRNLSQILGPESKLILDGFNGTIIINPSEETTDRYKKLQEEHGQFEENLQKDSELPSTTKDGTNIELSANIEFVHEVSDVKNNNARGVGLFRTESVFIEKKLLPDEEEQFRIYKQLAEQLMPDPVTIRTIDLGGDKFLENYNPEDELNPFLGWRAIRFCLDQPEIFKTQLRAILRASVYGKLNILIPMISSIEEIIQTRTLLNEAREELKKRNLAYKENIPLGIMVETPAAAMMASRLLEYVDYFSIGTNDLTQYVLTIDRTNDKVSKSYNTFNPAVLSFIEQIINAGKKAGKPVVLCGEFAANPDAVPLLLGMGLRLFSMNPYAIAKVKRIIRTLNIKECNQLLVEAKQIHTAKEIEKLCHDFLKENLPDMKFLS